MAIYFISQSYSPAEAGRLTLSEYQFWTKHRGWCLRLNILFKCILVIVRLFWCVKRGGHLNQGSCDWDGFEIIIVQSCLKKESSSIGNHCHLFTKVIEIVSLSGATL